jgi:hypothetical protein
MWYAFLTSLLAPESAAQSALEQAVTAVRWMGVPASGLGAALNACTDHSCMSAWSAQPPTRTVLYLGLVHCAPWQRCTPCSWLAS